MEDALSRTSPPPFAAKLRKDAQVRRDRLIDSAVELYALHGADVPLERIAEHAGVARPTLYRNFPDREALTAAVLEVNLRQFATAIAGWADRDDALFAALRLMAHRTLRAGGMNKIPQTRRDAGALMSQFGARVDQMLDAPLARAKVAGLVRADLTVAEVHRAARMIAGGAVGEPGEVGAQIDASLALLLAGLSTRG